MKKYKKISDTSIRVLETLKFLYEKSASIQDIIRHFEKIDSKNRIYTNEVILKYINTLKVFGFRFAKEKDKYVLLNSPNQMSFDDKDLRAIYLVGKFSEILPEDRIKENINKFLQDIEKRFSENTKTLAGSLKRPDLTSFPFDYSKYTDCIKIYEKYCIDGQRLKLKYKNINGIKMTIMVEPIDIKYLEQKVYFSVYNPVSAQVQDIEINSIISTEQLPIKMNSTTICSSVTFRLKDRLAKAYKLHEGEELFRLEQNGDIIILNKREDRALLLRRLMRYGENCELISPNNLKESMKQLIKNTLSFY